MVKAIVNWAVWPRQRNPSTCSLMRLPYDRLAAFKLSLRLPAASSGAALAGWLPLQT